MFVEWWWWSIADRHNLTIKFESAVTAEGFEFLQQAGKFLISASFPATGLRWSCQAGASYLSHLNAPSKGRVNRPLTLHFEFETASAKFAALHRQRATDAVLPNNEGFL